MNKTENITQNYRNYYCIFCEKEIGFAYMGVNIPASHAVMICLDCFSKGENPMRNIKLYRDGWEKEGGLLLNNWAIGFPEDLLLNLLEKFIKEGSIKVGSNKNGLEGYGTILWTKKTTLMPLEIGTIHGKK